GHPQGLPCTIAIFNWSAELKEHMIDDMDIFRSCQLNVTAKKLPASYPFSLTELRAAAKHLPREAATQLLRALLEQARSEEQEHEKYAERYRASGREPEPLEFYLPDQVLAYLTLVSSDAATRVDAIMQRRWA